MQGITEQHASDVRHQRRHGSKVYISPGQVMGESQVVEFVAEISVAAIGRHLQGNGDRRQQVGDCDVSGKPGLVRPRGGARGGTWQTYEICLSRTFHILLRGYFLRSSRSTTPSLILTTR